MNLRLTKKEKEVLRHASFSCSCESYSSYQCYKCRQIAEGFIVDRSKEVESMKTAGFITYESYGGYFLTPSGRTILEQLDK